MKYREIGARAREVWIRGYRVYLTTSQVYTYKQQTTIRKPIEFAPEASSGGREWAEMTEGFHLDGGVPS